MILVPVWYAADAGWLAFLVLRMTNRSGIFKTFCSELVEKTETGQGTVGAIFQGPTSGA
jgi:hypothetical protein